MNDQTKSRIRDLMFYVVPDPDEVIDDDVLARSEAVGYEEGLQLNKEFRALMEFLNDWPDAKSIILHSLDEMEASGREATGDDVEWRNVRDVMGRRIRRALVDVLSAD